VLYVYTWATALTLLGCHSTQVPCSCMLYHTLQRSHREYNNDVPRTSLCDAVQARVRLGKQQINAFEVHLEELLPQLSARAVTARRHEAQKKKRGTQLSRQNQKKQHGKVSSGRKKKPGSRKNRTAAHGCGGGSVAKGMVAHSIATDGVALSIYYRHEKDVAGAEKTPQQLVAEWKDGVGDSFEEEKWVSQESGGGEASTSTAGRKRRHAGGQQGGKRGRSSTPGRRPKAFTVSSIFFSHE